MKKRSRRTIRAELVPPLVATMVVAPFAELRNHAALENLRSGKGSRDDFNLLADAHGSLLLGATMADELDVVAAAETFRADFISIRDRAQRTGKYSVSGDEWANLCSMLEISEAFWPQQSAVTLVDTYRELKRRREIELRQDP